MKLQVVKPLTYATRHMQPGEVFEARTARDRRVLLATRKVRELREPANVPPPPAAVAERLAGDEDARALRAEYAAVTGRNPFLGWNAETLREKIAAAKAG